MAVLRPVDISATAVSAMVGVGIFFTPGLLLRQGASPTTILVLFAAGGFAVLMGAFTLADLARQYPGNGGPYRYLKRLGPLPAFLYNWSRFWVMQCGALAALSLTSMRFLAAGLGVKAPFWEAVAALGVLAAVTGLNMLGLRTGARVQAAFTALKLATILALAAGMLLAVAEPTFQNRSNQDLSGGLGSWALLAIFAYGGWSQVTFLAGETDRPIRRPLAVGVLIVTGLYLVALSAMFVTGPSGEVIAAEAAGALYGPVAQRIVAFVIAVAVLGGLHTMTMTGPRLYQAVAKDGRWWRPFAQDNRFGSPGKALLFQAEWAGILIAFSLLAQDAFSVLIGSISTAIWLFHLLTAIAWFRGRGAISMWAPLGFGLLAATVIALAAWQDAGAVQAGRLADVASLWALLSVASGIPVWWLSTRSARAAPVAVT